MVDAENNACGTLAIKIRNGRTWATMVMMASDMVFMTVRMTSCGQIAMAKMKILTRSERITSRHCRTSHTRNIWTATSRHIGRICLYSQEITFNLKTTENYEREY